MVARLIEGWESSTAVADYAGKWTALTAASLASAAGRNGNGLRCTSNAHFASRTFDAQATWVVGFALRFSVMPGSAIAVLSLMDTAVVHCGVAVQSDGTLSAWRGTTATVLGAGSGAPLSANTWYYVEAKFTIHDTAGVAALRVNGASVLSLTSQDTRNAGNSTANIVRVGTTVSPSGNWDFDDVYILDGTGSVNNDFLGDCKVSLLLPNGAGATTAWTPSAGSNYQAVDEAPPTGDTDYVSSATAGQTDTYAFGDLAVTGAVKAVQATAYCRKDDAGSRSLALVTRPGSTDRVGATQSVLDSYSMLPQVWDTNPDTAAPWSVSDVNASQFGERLIA